MLQRSPVLCSVPYAQGLARQELARIVRVTNAFDSFMAAAGVRLASSSIGPLATVVGESYFDQIAGIDAGYWQGHALVPLDASALAAPTPGGGCAQPCELVNHGFRQ